MGNLVERNYDLETFEGQRRFLFDLGHFVSDEFPDMTEATFFRLCRKVTKRTFSVIFEDAVKSYQDYAGTLKTDGWFAAKTIGKSHERRCLCPDIQPLSDVQLRWEIPELVVWGEELEGKLQDGGEDKLWMDGWADWMQYIPRDVRKWRESDDKILNVFARAIRIDGPGGILAWSGVAPKNAGLHTTLEQRFDPADGRNQLQGTARHEIGHALGLLHSKNKNDLMYAYMNGTDRVMPGDVKKIQALYGKRPTEPEPDPQPPPDDGVVTWETRTTTTDGRTITASYRLE